MRSFVLGLTGSLMLAMGASALPLVEPIEPIFATLNEVEESSPPTVSVLSHPNEACGETPFASLVPLGFTPQNKGMSPPHFAFACVTN